MTLTDAWAKLTRARLLNTELVRVTKAFRDSDPYEFLQFSNENDHTDPKLRFQWRLHVKTPYPMEAAWIVGDAIQNMRAALDTALAMVVTHQAETQPTPQEWRRIQYPITDTPDMFKPQRKKLAKWVSAATVEAVEDHQPWKDEQSSDDNRFLAKLRDLSNTDKHQQLLVTDHAVVNTEFKMNGLDPRDLDIRPRQAVMKDGETLLTVHCARPLDSGDIEVVPRFEQIEVLQHPKHGIMPLPITMERMFEAAFFAVFDLTFDLMTDGDKFMAKSYIDRRDVREDELRRTVIAEDRL